MGLNEKHYYRFTYLKSDHWLSLRIARIAKDKGRCIVCNRELGLALDVHHVEYRNLYDVQLTDLKSMCRRCHNGTHEVLKAFPHLKQIKTPCKRWGQTFRHIRMWHWAANDVGEDSAIACMQLREWLRSKRRKEHKIAIRRKRLREENKHLTMLIGEKMGTRYGILQWAEIMADIEQS